MNSLATTTPFISNIRRLDPFAVGFDNLFDQFDLMLNEKQSNFPRYNIDHYEDDVTKISMALAGYDEKEIEVTHEDNKLNISAKVQLETDGSASHRGIAHRSFSQKFILGEHMEVQSATFKNGLLIVTLKKIIPEHKKLKAIPINKE